LPYLATFENMAYCISGWTSPLRYKELITVLGGEAVSSSSTAAEAHPQNGPDL